MGKMCRNKINKKHPSFLFFRTVTTQLVVGVEDKYSKCEGLNLMEKQGSKASLYL